jgi:hypothetical protein
MVNVDAMIGGQPVKPRRVVGMQDPGLLRAPWEAWTCVPCRVFASGHDDMAKDISNLGRVCLEVSSISSTTPKA